MHDKEDIRGFRDLKIAGEKTIKSVYLINIKIKGLQFLEMFNVVDETGYLKDFI